MAIRLMNALIPRRRRLGWNWGGQVNQQVGQTGKEDAGLRLEETNIATRSSFERTKLALCQFRNARAALIDATTKGRQALNEADAAMTGWTGPAQQQLCATAEDLRKVTQAAETEIGAVQIVASPQPGAE